MQFQNSFLFFYFLCVCVWGAEHISAPAYAFFFFFDRNPCLCLCIPPERLGLLTLPRPPNSLASLSNATLYFPGKSHPTLYLHTFKPNYLWLTHNITVIQQQQILFSKVGSYYYSNIYRKQPDTHRFPKNKQ